VTVEIAAIEDPAKLLVALLAPLRLATQKDRVVRTAVF
jgi:hypothetical protein